MGTKRFRPRPLSEADAKEAESNGLERGRPAPRDSPTQPWSIRGPHHCFAFPEAVRL